LRGRGPKVLLLLALVPWLCGCYLIDQGRGQLRLRLGQIPLEQATALETDPKTKALLAQVPKIKAFGERRLYLKNNSNYEGYYPSLGEGITYVVTAARKTELVPYTWWFPVLGAVPYKGFFDRNSALQLQGQLEQEGYDTHLFAAPAYSTLGWFKDPITTQMLHQGLPSLTETLLHEMTHSTLYKEDQGDFNEQLASFVGEQGMRLYLSEEQGWTKEQFLELDQENTKAEEMGRLIREALPRFETLYQDAALTEPEKLNRRKVLFAELETTLQAQLGWKVTLNNARLLQFRRYNPQDPRFAQTLAQVGGDWQRFWVEVEKEALANPPGR